MAVTLPRVCIVMKIIFQHSDSREGNGNNSYNITHVWTLMLPHVGPIASVLFQKDSIVPGNA